MTTPVPRGTNASRMQRGRHVSPLLIGSVLLILIIAGVVITNGRATRGPRPLTILSTQDFHALAWSPVEPSTVFFGHHDGMLVILHMD